MKRPRDEAGADTGTEAQVEHLLGVVHRHRDERCAKLRDLARAQAKSLLQKAHEQARAHMHQHIVNMRETYRQRIAAARARNDTLLRLRQQHASQAMLDNARQPLREALRRRWQNESARNLWIGALLNVAARTLLAHDWRIEHPPDWPQAERDELRRRLLPLGVTAPDFVAWDDIEAGLRIVADCTVIDATLIGLLQHKTAIEARLMAGLMPLAADRERQRGAAEDTEHDA